MVVSFFATTTFFVSIFVKGVFLLDSFFTLKFQLLLSESLTQYQSYFFLKVQAYFFHFQ